MISYLDTNVIVRLTTGDLGQISKRARQQIEKSDLLISPMVLLELEMLHEIGRLKVRATQLMSELAPILGLEVCRLSMASVMAAALEVKWTREPGDRLIVAHASANGSAPLISSDRAIREHYKNTVW